MRGKLEVIRRWLSDIYVVSDNINSHKNKHWGWGGEIERYGMRDFLSVVGETFIEEGVCVCVMDRLKKEVRKFEQVLVIPLCFEIMQKIKYCIIL